MISTAKTGRVYYCIEKAKIRLTKRKLTTWRREDTKEKIEILDYSALKPAAVFENCKIGEVKVSRRELVTLLLYSKVYDLLVKNEPEYKTTGLVFGHVLGAKAWEIRLPLRLYIEKTNEVVVLPTFHFLNPPTVSAKVRRRSGVRMERIFAEWAGEIKIIDGKKERYTIKLWWKGHAGGNAHVLVVEKIKEKTKLRKELEVLYEEHKKMNSKLASTLKRALDVLDEEIRLLRESKQYSNSKRFAKIKYAVFDGSGIKMKEGVVIARAVHNRAVRFGHQVLFIEKGLVDGGTVTKEEWKPFGLRGFFNHVIKVDKIYKPKLEDIFNDIEAAKRVARHAFVRRPVRIKTYVDLEKKLSITEVSPAGKHAAALRIINKDHAGEGFDRVYVYLQQKTRLQFLHGL